MGKLLFVYEQDIPTIGIIKNNYLNLRNHPWISSSFKNIKEIMPCDIDSHDIIIFIRPDNTYSWRIAKEARKTGHTIATLLDDDLLNLPSSIPSFPWRKKGVIKTLAYSDVIMSSNRRILKKYCPLTYGKRKALINTIVQPEELEHIKSVNNDKIKIVYAAGKGHSELFEKYISPIAMRLLEKYDISFTFVDVHPKIDGVKCEYIPEMPLIEYRKYMKNGNFDIGVAPLGNDVFSKCKYYNKFIEYTTHGIVGVYANTEPYTYVIKDGINGFLADSTPEAWYYSLDKAIKSKKIREQCLKNAISFLKDKHSEETCIKQLCQGIPEVLDNNTYLKCRKFKFKTIIIFVTHVLDLIYIAGFYLKKYGIQYMLRRTRAYIIKITRKYILNINKKPV